MLVITERHPAAPRREVLEGTEGRVLILREFPFRAGRARKDWLSLIAYFITNISYLKLPGIVLQWASQENSALRTLIHTSLFYNPNSLKRVVEKLRLNSSSTLIADVRDMQFPDAEIHLLDRFDRIVTSSHGVAEDLARRGASPNKITPIPMPFTFPPVPEACTVQATLEKHGLTGKRFLLNPNGISRAKLYVEMREAMPLIRSMPEMQDVELVSVGRDRDRTDKDNEVERSGSARFLGPIPREELLSLMRAAMFTLILSPNEAISRAALEAMAVGGRVILPDVAEFRVECASHICTDPTPANIARMVTKLADAATPRFGFERHLEPNYLPLYRALHKVCN